MAVQSGSVSGSASEFSSRTTSASNISLSSFPQPPPPTSSACRSRPATPALPSSASFCRSLDSPSASDSPQTKIKIRNTATSGRCCPSFPLSFPFRASPPPSVPSPPCPQKAYAEMRRWVSWRPPRYGESQSMGFWYAEWSPSPPNSQDAARLVRELVHKQLLLPCFTPGTNAIHVSDFANGAFNCLFLLRCSCYFNGMLGHSEAPPASTDGSQYSDLGSQSQRQRQPQPPEVPTELLLRLAMPLDPYFKMEAEMAALHFARVRGLPVPTVYMYASSADNVLGLEWSIMQKIDNACTMDDFEDEVESISRDWRQRPCDHRAWSEWNALGHSIADHLSALQRPAFDKIGSLYWDHSEGTFFVGPPSDPFLVANRRLLYYDTSDSEADQNIQNASGIGSRLTRRPFEDLGEYLNAYLEVWLRDITEPSLDAGVDQDRDQHPSEERPSPAGGGDGDGCNTDQNQEDKDACCYFSPHDIESIAHLASQLRNTIIPYLTSKYSSTGSHTWTTHVSHPDLHGGNILLHGGDAGPFRDTDTCTDSDSSLDEYEARLRDLRRGCRLRAFIDWEHVLVLPWFLVLEPHVQELFPCPDEHCAYVPHESLLIGEHGDTPASWLLASPSARLSFQTALAHPLCILNQNNEWPQKEDGGTEQRTQRESDQDQERDDDGEEPWPPNARAEPWKICRRVVGPFAALVTTEPDRLELLLARVHSELLRLGRCEARWDQQAWIDELAEAIKLKQEQEQKQERGRAGKL